MHSAQRGSKSRPSHPRISLRSNCIKVKQRNKKVKDFGVREAKVWPSVMLLVWLIGLNICYFSSPFISFSSFSFSSASSSLYKKKTRIVLLVLMVLLKAPREAFSWLSKPCHLDMEDNHQLNQSGFVSHAFIQHPITCLYVFSCHGHWMGAFQSVHVPLLSSKNTRNWPSTNTKSPGTLTLILGFSTSKTMRNQFLLFRSHLRCIFLATGTLTLFITVKNSAPGTGL